MIVRRFLAWAQSAPEDPRVSAAAALARAFLSEETCAAERCDAEAALTLLLDDPSPAVRLALAETLAESDLAPRHIVSALAAEPGRTGEVLLEHSPVLGEVDLIERVATGDSGAQAAVARRDGLSGPVAAALAEVGEVDAVLALASNPNAECPDFAVTRIVERFGADERVRQALERRHLTVTQRYALQVAAAKAGSMAVKDQPSWRAERAERESMERAALLLARQGEPERAEMIVHLRGAGHLTAGLLLRAAAQADAAFITEALASLSKTGARRVAGLVAETRGSGFAAVCSKAGLSQAVTTALRAALEAHRDIAARGFPVGEASRSREACRATLHACKAAGLDTHEVASMFRRLELEFSREAARVAAEKLLEQHRLETEGPLLLGAPVLRLPAPDAAAPEAAGEEAEEASVAPAVDEEWTEPEPLAAVAVAQVEAAAEVGGMVTPDEARDPGETTTGLAGSPSALDQAFSALKAALEPFGPTEPATLDAALRPDPVLAAAEAGEGAPAERDWAALLASTFDLPADVVPAPEQAQEAQGAAAALAFEPPAELSAELHPAAVGASFLAEFTASASVPVRLVVGHAAAEAAPAESPAVVDIPSAAPAPRTAGSARPAVFAPAQPDLSAWERVFDRADELASLDGAAGHDLHRETMAEMLREAVEAMQRRGGAVEVSRDRMAGAQAA